MKVSTSKKSIATVKAVKKNKKVVSYKVSAKKAGKATITIKVKKGTYKGTYKCKVTVKKKVTPTVTPKPTAKASQAPATQVPSNAPSDAPGTDPSAAPSAEPSLSPDDDTRKNAAKIEFTLTNPYSDEYKDTLLVGTNANVKAKALDKDGKPVAGVPITMTSADIQGLKNSTATAGYDYDNLTDPTLTTGADGTATFVFGLDKTKDGNKNAIDAMNKEFIASYKLTATVAGSNVRTDTVVKFAAIRFGNSVAKSDSEKRDTMVKIANHKDTNDALVKNADASKAEANVVYDDSASVAQKQNVEYVSSQQVSKTGADHSVKFSSCAYLDMPAGDADNTAQAIDKTVDLKSGAYSVYADNEQDYLIEDVNASKLQYATVNFSKMNLSRYSKVAVWAYLVKSPEDAKKDGKLVNVKDLPSTAKSVFLTSWVEDGQTKYGPVAKEYGSDDVNTAKGGQCQIKLEDDASGYLYIAVKLLSPGQVNRADNQGYEIDKITGTYRKGVVQSDNKLIRMKDVSIDWAKSTTAGYEPWKKLEYGSDDSTNNAIDKIFAATGYWGGGYPGDEYTYQYTVPAYPNVGNGYVAIYKSGTVRAYYAVDTVNEKNENKLLGDNVYKVSKDEVAAEGGFAGDITVKEDIVTVDSQKEGVTSLVGTVTTTNSDVKIDAANSKIYTSVQWNPVARASETTSVGVAFKGQTITAKAGLVDVNGNKAAIAGTPITFGVTGNDDLKQGNSVNSGAAYVSAISNGSKTDANGEVSISFKAEDLTAIAGLTAKTSDKKFDVVFNLGSDSASTVDLVWLSPSITFGSKITGYGTDYTKYEAADGKIGLSAAKKDSWDYGVMIDAVYPDMSKTSISNWTEYHIAASGITAFVEYDEKSSDAKITDNKNNSATVAFGEKAVTGFKFKFTKESLGNSITGNLIDKDWAHSTALHYVGTGDASLDGSKEFEAKLDATETKMAVKPAAGGYNVDSANSGGKTAYVIVTDEFGTPVKEGTEVELDVTGTTFATEAAYGKSGAITAAPGATSQKGTLKADKNGRVVFTLTDPSSPAGKKATVIASCGEGTTRAVFTWVDKTAAPLKITNVGAYDAKTNTITLIMNQNVVADSVKKELFQSKTNGLAGAIEHVGGDDYLLDSVSVSGNKITLKISDTFKESIKAGGQFKIKTDTAGLDTGFKASDGTTAIKQKLTSEATGEEIDLDLTFTVLDNGKMFADTATTSFSNVALPNWTKADYDALGVTGVTAENITSIQSGIGAKLTVLSITLNAANIKSEADLQKAKQDIQKAVDATLAAAKTAAETVANDIKGLTGKGPATGTAAAVADVTVAPKVAAYAALDAYQKGIADAKIAEITTTELSAQDRKYIDAVAVQTALTAEFITNNSATVATNAQTSTKKLTDYTIFGSKVKLAAEVKDSAATPNVFVKETTDGKLVINPTGSTGETTNAGTNDESPAKNTVFKIQIQGTDTYSDGDYEIQYSVSGMPYDTTGSAAGADNSLKVATANSAKIAVK